MKNPIILGRAINVALVGCGHISVSHLAAIDEHANHLNLVAICDTNKDIGEKLAAQRNIKFYTEFSLLLEENELDLVVLCTPSFLHCSQAIMAARAGCHVLTEKPVAINWKDGLKMVKTCEEAGVCLFEVKQNRLMLPIQHLKKSIDTGRFGKIYMANLNVFWTRPQAYYSQNSWRGTWAFDGGIFMNQASHHVDLLRWLIGPIESVNAFMATLDRKIETEDTGALNLRWRSGTIGSVNVTVLTYLKNFETSITILGEKGTVHLGGIGLNEVKKWEFSEPIQADESMQYEVFPTSIGHKSYYKNLICSLQGECVDIVDGRDALGTLEVLTAAYRSARDGVTVHLPLEY